MCKRYRPSEYDHQSSRHSQVMYFPGIKVKANCDVSYKIAPTYYCFQTFAIFKIMLL